MIIKNGLVWEESGSFRKKELVVDTTTHRIAETAEDDTVFDAEGLYEIPGLVDVHIHGARGHDFSDGNSKGLAEIAQYLHSCGVTSFCPTSMTLPEEQLTAAFATINDVPDAAGYAHIAGIHMEGPYLSPEKKGAQKASYLHAPDAAMSPICSTPCRHYTTAILALSARQRTVRMRWQRSSVTASTSTRRSSAMPSACLATTA